MTFVQILWRTTVWMAAMLVMLVGYKVLTEGLAAASEPTFGQAVMVNGAIGFATLLAVLFGVELFDRAIARRKRQKPH